MAKPWYVNMAVGMVGALVGGILGGVIGLRSVHIVGELLLATAGAVLCLYLLKRYGR